MEKVRVAIIKCLEDIGIFVEIEDCDENLIEYGMSSLDYVMLICDIEEALDIKFPEEYLIIQNGVSINKLAEVVWQCEGLKECTMS